MSKQTQNEAPDLVNEAHPLVAALAATRAERAALLASDVTIANVDMARAATIALGAYPAIAAMLTEMKLAVPECDAALIRSIPTKADAALQAHGNYLAASTPDPELPALHVEADALRRVMRADLERAVCHGTIAADRLKGLCGLVGYRNVASDLGILTSVARTDAAALTGKTGISEAELARAEKVVARMWHAIAMRESTLVRVDAADDERQRAFVLLDRAYDAARRVVAFVRWKEGDANEIAPSLRSRQARHHVKGAKAEKAGVVPPG